MSWVCVYIVVVVGLVRPHCQQLLNLQFHVEWDNNCCPVDRRLFFPFSPPPFPHISRLRPIQYLGFPITCRFYCISKSVIANICILREYYSSGAHEAHWREANPLLWRIKMERLLAFLWNSTTVCHGFRLFSNSPWSLSTIEGSIS